MLNKMVLSVESSKQTRHTAWASGGEDASADMLYGDINLDDHRANAESS